MTQPRHPHPPPRPPAPSGSSRGPPARSARPSVPPSTSWASTSSRPTSASRASLGERDQVVAADVADLEGLIELVAGRDGVVHLGGIADEADFHDLATVNVVGTYHVLEAARRAGVGRVVFASSNRLTGSYDTDTTVDPAMPPRPDGFYGVSKVAGEALCRLYADKFGLSRRRPHRQLRREPELSPARAHLAEPADAVARVRRRDDDRRCTRRLLRGLGERATVVGPRGRRGPGLRAAGRRGRRRSAERAPSVAHPAAPQGGPFAAVAFSLDRMTR